MGTGVKWPRHEADRSPASSAEVNMWSYFHFPICLLCVQRHNLKRTNNITIPTRREIKDITNYTISYKFTPLLKIRVKTLALVTV
jgi:hypothetical protein